MVGPGRADHGPDRSRDLHRQRHPGLPWPQRRVDPEPGSREGVEPADLPLDAGGAAGGVADPPRRRHLPRRTERRTPSAGRAGTPGAARRDRHPEHRRVAPTRRERPRACDRGARQRPPHDLLELPRPPSHGRGDRTGAGRRGGSAVPRLRRDPEERHDQLRAATRPGGDRRRVRRRRALRPDAGDRLDPVGVPRRRRGAGGEAGGGPRGDPQRRADRTGRRRRRRGAGPDRYRPTGARRTVAAGQTDQ